MNKSESVRDYVGRVIDNGLENVILFIFWIVGRVIFIFWIV